ncbi:MAG TPA: maleylpyruvate isomerase family mycothiol-dependent enzyme, partial [Acidimicrobiales bacterium]|nr:maleylpyruvate isomerase family mycothiol-dependent enzyme [Acidimicrobiales bacterium]
MDSPLDVLRHSVARLHQLVGDLDDAGLEAPSYCDGWSIAAVLSHLGSGAVLLQRSLQDARDGAETPGDLAPEVWAVWDAKVPRQQADNALAEDDALLGVLDSFDETERAQASIAFGPMRVGFDEAVRLRLNEHAFHTWDIEVTRDAGAGLPDDAAALVVDNLGLIARFTAKPSGDSREVRVRTTGPERHFTVRLTPDKAELLDGDAGVSPDLTLPAEAFCRLVYGRLDPDHSPAVSENGEVLDLL